MKLHGLLNTLRLAVTMSVASAAISAERIVLLPFNGPTATESARGMFDYAARARLESKKLDIVDADSTSNVLRSLRIRNTAAPLENEIKALCDSLDAQFVIVGTVHSFVVDSVFSEISVCTRMLLSDNSTLVWQNCATITGGGTHSLFSKPAHKSERKLARAAANQLFSTLKLSRSSRKQASTELAGSGNSSRSYYPCLPIAVIPPVDESEVPYSGDMIGNFLVSSLARHDFIVIDPGRVRNVMLACEDLRYGQSVGAVSKMLSDSLDAALVVTGTISKLTPVRLVTLGNSPEVAVELRMIDPKSNSVVWADHLERTGRSHKGLFDLGIIYSPAALASEVIDDAISDLKVIRRKVAEPLN